MERYTLCLAAQWSHSCFDDVLQLLLVAAAYTCSFTQLHEIRQTHVTWQSQGCHALVWLVVVSKDTKPALLHVGIVMVSKSVL